MKKRALFRICVTGGIASGKTCVGEILRWLGAPVIEADGLCHELMRRGGPLFDRVVSGFGRKILRPDNEIDRRALGQIVFGDRVKREKLNAIVHPEVRRVIEAWVGLQHAACRADGARRANGASIVAAIIPLLYEVGWERDWDWAICVAAPDALRISRLKRKGFSGNEARDRIAAQMPLIDKMERADNVIFNAGTLDGLRQQTGLLFRNIKEQVEKRHG